MTYGHRLFCHLVAFASGLFCARGNEALSDDRATAVMVYTFLWLIASGAAWQALPVSEEKR